MENKTYHIIGGGIAGLNTAKYIKLKYPDAKTVIYEAANRAGGRCCSFYDKHLQTNIDTGTHVVLGANKNAAKFLQNENFEKVFFADAKSQLISSGVLKNRKEIALAVFNTDIKNIPLKMLFAAAFQLFPFMGKKTKAYYSNNDLSEKFINPFLSYADELKLCHSLKSFREKNGKITELEFDKSKIALGKNDIIISALDAHNYNKLFGGSKFEFNSIINIFYKTGTKIVMPDGLSFLGVKNGLPQWIFANEDTLSVTISNTNNIKLNNSELAASVWAEICALCKCKNLKMPDYKIICSRRATIKQDKKNNKLRPVNGITNWSNLFIAGDWTIKNFPCCIEGAVLSAKRVVLYI